MDSKKIQNIISALGALLVLAACATPQVVGPPQMPDVLPGAPPETLVRPDDAIDGPIAITAEDGYVYLAGLVEARPGELFTLQHGGRWDETMGPRPVIGLVRALRVYEREGRPLVLAQPEYVIPEVAINGAVVRVWDEPTPPRVTKGLAQITALDERQVSLDRGFADGVIVGDRFLVLERASATDHLGDRLVGLILITRIFEDKAEGEILLQGGIKSKVAEGMWALFAGPGRSEAPLKGVLEVGKIVDGDSALQDRVLGAAQRYLEAWPAWHLTARASELELDPLGAAFGRPQAGQPYVHEPRLLLAGKVVEREGVRHLILNYTNLGLSVAHGMVAAVPEEGMDVGPLDTLNDAALRPVLHTALGAALTHRGQNTEALYLLESALRTGGWDGPARWHARDQLAMRWVQAGFVREALRLVQEDIERARETQDKLALINAVGTLYALYDELGLGALSVLTARAFWEERKAIGEGPFTTHALRAYVETLYKEKRRDEAQALVDNLEQTCAPDIERAEGLRREGRAVPEDLTHCVIDLHFIYLGAYWQLLDAPDIQARYRDRALELAYLMEPTNIASIRIIQALEALRSGDTDGATIAFLEATRLFDKERYLPGVARVNALRVNLHLAQDSRQKAFDVAMDGADEFARSQDLQELASLYRTVARLYMNIPPEDVSVAAYVREAPAVLGEALKLQLGEGDLGSAAEIYYISGRFRLGSNPEEADQLLDRSIQLALKVTRFDIASLASLTRAIVSRARGSSSEFHGHLEMARRFAELWGDPELLQIIIQAEQGGSLDRPTL